MGPEAGGGWHWGKLGAELRRLDALSGLRNEGHPASILKFVEIEVVVDHADPPAHDTGR